MSKFALKEVPNVSGKIKFFKIEIDGYCQFDDFEEQIEKEASFKKQLITIYARLNEVAKLKLLPKKKFRDITEKGDINKEFEIKTNDLRVYITKDHNGHIIILGGKKESQDEDIRTFRSIKKRYFDLKQ